MHHVWHRWLLDSKRLPFFDDVDDPKFFGELPEAEIQSQAQLKELHLRAGLEAAAYFYAAVAPYMPPAKEINYVDYPPFEDHCSVGEQLTMMAFRGPGQWFLVAVERDATDGAPRWEGRQASAACVAPEEAVAVIDLSGMAEYEVCGCGRRARARTHTHTVSYPSLIASRCAPGTSVTAARPSSTSTSAAVRCGSSRNRGSTRGQTRCPSTCG